MTDFLMSSPWNPRGFCGALLQKVLDSISGHAFGPFARETFPKALDQDLRRRQFNLRDVYVKVVDALMLNETNMRPQPSIFDPEQK